MASRTEGAKVHCCTETTCRSGRVRRPKTNLDTLASSKTFFPLTLTLPFISSISFQLRFDVDLLQIRVRVRIHPNAQAPAPLSASSDASPLGLACSGSFESTLVCGLPLS